MCRRGLFLVAIEEGQVTTVTDIHTTCSDQTPTMQLQRLTELMHADNLWYRPNAALPATLLARPHNIRSTFPAPATEAELLDCRTGKPRRISLARHEDGGIEAWTTLPLGRFVLVVTGPLYLAVQFWTRDDEHISTPLALTVAAHTTDQELRPYEHCGANLHDRLIEHRNRLQTEGQRTTH